MLCFVKSAHVPMYRTIHKMLVNIKTSWYIKIFFNGYLSNFFRRRAFKILRTVRRDVKKVTN